MQVYIEHLLIENLRGQTHTIDFWIKNTDNAAFRQIDTTRTA